MTELNVNDRVLTVEQVTMTLVDILPICDNCGSVNYMEGPPGPESEGEDAESLITAETDRGWTKLSLPELGYVAGYGTINGRHLAILIRAL